MKWVILFFAACLLAGCSSDDNSTAPQETPEGVWILSPHDGDTVTVRAENLGRPEEPEWVAMDSVMAHIVTNLRGGIVSAEWRWRSPTFVYYPTSQDFYIPCIRPGQGLSSSGETEFQLSLHAVAGDSSSWCSPVVTIVAITSH
jgi:hypothetical protein